MKFEQMPAQQEQLNKYGHTPEQAAEIRARSESAIWDSLNITDGNIENFEEELHQAIERLPKYQEIMQELEAVEQQDIPKRLYELLEKKETDKDENDGVLIKSMKEGTLHCAGRTMIASRVLEHSNIKHWLVSAPDHIMILIQPIEETLIYFDPNNNAGFSFAADSLYGFTGGDEYQKCNLVDVRIRENDESWGDGYTFEQGGLMPVNFGEVRSYLDNLKCALYKTQEFEHTDIEQDEEAGDYIEEIKKELLDEHILAEFNEHREYMEKSLKEKDVFTKEYVKIFLKAFKDVSEKEEFVEKLLSEFSGDFWQQFPNMSHSHKVEWLEEKWDRLQQDGTVDYLKEKYQL